MEHCVEITFKKKFECFFRRRNLVLCFKQYKLQVEILTNERNAVLPNRVLNKMFLFITLFFCILNNIKGLSGPSQFLWGQC